MLEEEVGGTVCTFWKSFWDLERNPPRHRPLAPYSPGERDRASYSVFYKTKHPQCYDLFCKALMTSSQESKEPPTLHFNFQQKTFTTLNYYRCWLLKKPSQPLCLLLIVVMASFYGGGACSRLILSEKGEVHFWGKRGTIKRAKTIQTSWYEK